MSKDEPIFLFDNQASWEDWLEEHHTQETAVWLKIAKKASPVPSVTYNEAVESSLCYGWIDGLVNSFDEHFYIQRFTPRRSKSVWSKINREKAEKLMKNKRMKPAGLAHVETAKQDGRWDAAYEGSKTAEIPSDFLEALKKHPEALAFYQSLNKTNQYAIFWRLQTAAKPETRQRRLEKFVAMMIKKEKFY